MPKDAPTAERALPSSTACLRVLRVEVKHTQGVPHTLYGLPGAQATYCPHHQPGPFSWKAGGGSPRSPTPTASRRAQHQRPHLCVDWDARGHRQTPALAPTPILQQQKLFLENTVSHDLAGPEGRARAALPRGANLLSLKGDSGEGEGRLKVPATCEEEGRSPPGPL